MIMWINNCSWNRLGTSSGLSWAPSYICSQLADHLRAGWHWGGGSDWDSCLSSPSLSPNHVTGRFLVSLGSELVHTDQSKSQSFILLVKSNCKSSPLLRNTEKGFTLHGRKCKVTLAGHAYRKIGSSGIFIIDHCHIYSLIFN